MDILDDRGKESEVLIVAGATNTGNESDPLIFSIAPNVLPIKNIKSNASIIVS
jgi:hypothetical protein